MPDPAARPPAVAGRFYPGDRRALERELDRCLRQETPSEPAFARALGCVVPHAGYVYSGAVAGAVYRRLPQRARFLILGPNHFGRGEPLALMSEGVWLTPLGRATIDRELARALRRHAPLLADDPVAHAAEHSLEVQIPFLQRLYPAFIFVPIAIGVVHYAALEALGHGVAQSISGLKDRPLIVASSDMNHYEPDALTRAKDHEAIEQILALDPQGLWDVIHRRDISMCGYGPVVAMLTAVRDLGARQATLVRYATSADASGDTSAVVGYAGIVVE
jgi:AmmeMemoRadiSam system protein B